MRGVERGRGGGLPDGLIAPRNDLWSYSPLSNGCFPTFTHFYYRLFT